MAAVIPVILSEACMLVKEKSTNNFAQFSASTNKNMPHVPYFHHYAANVDKTLGEFKAFLKDEYPHLLSKPAFAVVLPDDATALETAFIRSFFNSMSKIVAVMPMSLVLSQNEHYVSVSKTERTIAVHYVSNGEIKAEIYYNNDFFDLEQIQTDISRIHVEIGYNEVPVLLNNVNDNMHSLSSLGELVQQDEFQLRCTALKVEKA